MSQARVLVLTGYGTNCAQETAFSAKKVGADRVCIAHFSDLVQETYRVEDFNFLIFPGGFLDGDHLGAAQAAAIRFKFMKTRSGNSLIQSLLDLLNRNGLLLGICNGFQLLVKLGLLPAIDQKYLDRQVSLSYNDSAKFEDRWSRLKVNSDSPCIFTSEIAELYLPVRHGEGKVIVSEENLLEKIRHQNLICLQYVDDQGRVTQKYPHNPNGSPLGIAGLTDPSGQILGLMPHPEAFNHPTNHPAWNRGEKEPLGTILFEKAIDYLKR